MKKVMSLLLLLFFVFIQTYTQDWSSVLMEAKEKDAKFQADIKDLAIVLEMKIYEAKDKQAPDKVVSKIFKKSDKFRVESKMPMPGMDEDMKEMETVFIFDGKEYWVIAPFVGKQKVSVKEAKQYNTSSDWWN